MLEIVVWISIGGVFYAYFGYPLLLKLLLCLGFERVGERNAENRAETFSVIVTARNEEASIAEKLENTLALLQPSSEPVQFIVASDASDDATDEIVRSFAERGVELVALAERGGKEQAQYEALQKAQGEIVVFTDVKVRLEPDALVRFSEHFQDEKVGAVSSVDSVERDGSGEGLYVRYEMMLRRLESALSSVVGLSGSCFGVRRELCNGWRTDIPSDFTVLLVVQQEGLRGVHAEDIPCSYKAVKTEEEEFGRKVRTVLRGMSALFSSAEVMNPLRYPLFSWQVLSHKIFRWLVPWFIIVGSLAVLVLAPTSLLYARFAALGILFFGAAAVGYYRPELRNPLWMKVPLFFSLTNAAIALAWVQYLSGKRAVAWDPSKKESDEA